MPLQPVSFPNLVTPSTPPFTIMIDHALTSFQFPTASVTLTAPILSICLMLTITMQSVQYPSLTAFSYYGLVVIALNLFFPYTV